MQLKLPAAYISLKKLYQYYLAGEKGLGDVSRTTLRTYARAAEVLLSGIEEGLGFEDFKDRLAARILEEFRVEKAIDLLREEGLPANGETLAWALSKVGIRASVTTVRALLGLLKSIGVLRTRPLPVLARSPKERVYEYVLSRGAVKYRKLEAAFDNARILVLELVREGRLGVRLRRVELKLDGVEDWDDVKEGVLSEFLEEWTDQSGTVRRRIVIPGDAVVYVVPG